MAKVVSTSKLISGRSTVAYLMTSVTDEGMEVFDWTPNEELATRVTNKSEADQLIGRAYQFGLLTVEQLRVRDENA